jgi:radical SAM superfamily enzyme YgiQ (UPF0313 family)
MNPWETSHLLNTSLYMTRKSLQFNGTNHGRFTYAHGYSIEQILKDLAVQKPDAVGVTFTSAQYLSTLRVCQSVKEKHPHLPIIAGGPHVTPLPQETLENKCFDLGVIGEGELTFSEALEAFNQGDDLAHVPGLVFRRDDSVVLTAPQEKISDLDQLPYPAWDLLPSLTDPYRVSVMNSKSPKSTGIFTSRGCPGRCIFCDTSVFGRKTRFFSAQYVLGMLRELYQVYGINDFVVYDDSFCADRQRVIDICQGILDQGWKMSWVCCTRLNHVDRELLQQMKKAGCWQMEYGIESAETRVLKLMRKGININRAQEIIKMTHDLGIRVRGNFIIGNLGETKQSLEKTIQFIMSSDLDYVQQNFLTPYPGSEIFRVAGEHGQFDSDYNKMSNMTINFIPEALTKQDMEHYSRKMHLKFYLRPRSLWRFIRYIDSWQSFKNLLIAAWAFLSYVIPRPASHRKPKGVALDKV